MYNSLLNMMPNSLLISKLKYLVSANKLLDLV